MLKDFYNIPEKFCNESKSKTAIFNIKLYTNFIKPTPPNNIMWNAINAERAGITLAGLKINIPLHVLHRNEIRDNFGNLFFNFTPLKFSTRMPGVYKKVEAIKKQIITLPLWFEKKKAFKASNSTFNVFQ